MLRTFFSNSQASFLRCFCAAKCLLGFVLWAGCWVATTAAAETVLRVGGTGADLGFMRLLAQSFVTLHPDVRVEIPHSLGSGGGVRAVKKGMLDIGLTSRPLKKREQAPGLRAVLYAYTPLVFAVGRANPVEEISLTQLADIYAGRSRHWPHGGAARPILRPPSDSDSQLLRRRVPVLDEALGLAHQRRGIVIATTDQDSAQYIASVPGAVGTSTLALIFSEKRPLKAVKVTDWAAGTVRPDDGPYPLRKALYFVVQGDVSPAARDFLRYLQSAPGRELLQRTGHDAVDFDPEWL